MSCWQILGIECTSDSRTIKRAYAARLKETRPDQDPRGFQALREAYDRVLGQATGTNNDNINAEEDFSAMMREVCKGWDERTSASENPSDTTTQEAAPAPDFASNRQRDGAGTAHAPQTDAPQEATTSGAVADEIQETDQALPTVDEVLDSVSQCLQDGEDKARRVLDELWQERRWQTPDGSQELETGLLFRAEAELCLMYAESSPEQRHLEGLWLPLLAYAAQHYGWFVRPPGYLRLATKTLSEAWRWCVQQSIERICQQAQTQGTTAAAARLAAELRSDLFEYLGIRWTLKCAWVERLSAPELLPPDLHCCVVEAFDWQGDDTDLETIPGGAAVRIRYQEARERLLLRRLADMTLNDPAIPPHIAAALCKPRIDWRDRIQSILPGRPGKIRAALKALKTEHPITLSTISPDVHCFWLKAWGEPSAWWLLLYFIGWCAGALASMELANAANIIGFSFLLLLLLGMVIGIVAGFLVAWILAWIRLQWQDVYEDWRDWDMAIAQRIPWVGRIMRNQNIGLTRDLLPFAALFVWRFVVLLRLGGNSVGHVLFLALSVSLVLTVLWSVTLRVFSKDRE
jgi:hypothetical protein